MPILGQVCPTGLGNSLVTALQELELEKTQNQKYGGGVSSVLQEQNTEESQFTSKLKSTINEDEKSLTYHNSRF